MNVLQFPGACCREELTITIIMVVADWLTRYGAPADLHGLVWDVRCRLRAATHEEVLAEIEGLVEDGRLAWVGRRDVCLVVEP